MKLYPSNLDKLLKLLRSKAIKAILLYGPENGVSSLISKEIAKLFDSCCYLDTPSKDELMAEFYSLSLFGGTSLKVIRYKKEIESTLHEILNNEENMYFSLVLAEELQSGNGLRKMFESSSDLAVIACYPDNEIAVKNVILSFFKKEGKFAQSNVVEFISKNFTGDRMSMIRELEKISLFCANKNSVSVDDVIQTLSENISFESDKLCMLFMNKKFPEYFFMLDSIKVSGLINPVIIIKSLVKYYLNLYQIKATDSSFEDDFKKIEKQIFFAYVSDFKSAAAKITKENALSMLFILFEAEISVKTTNSYIPLYEIVYKSLNLDVHQL